MHQNISIYRKGVEREEGTPEGRTLSRHCVRILLFLIGISIHLQGRAKHIYVEAVLRRKTEGIFLEDPEAHCDVTMGQVSKLGGSGRCVAIRETDQFPCRNSQSTGTAPTLIIRCRRSI